MMRISSTLVALVLQAATLSLPAETPKKFDAKVKASAVEFRDDIGGRIEALLKSGKLSVPQLFDTFYIPIPNTYPQKFHTQYDRVFDEVLRGVLDGYLAREPRFIYVILTDVNGYVPTHNTRFAQPLTGNRDYDAKNNRTKQLFNDRTGLAAAHSKAPFLLQEYQRDTGESILDLSVPVFIRDRQWGCLRIGFRKD
jgi:methyl-accepting chemotaxis protein